MKKGKPKQRKEKRKGITMFERKPEAWREPLPHDKNILPLTHINPTSLDGCFHKLENIREVKDPKPRL